MTAPKAEVRLDAEGEVKEIEDVGKKKKTPEE